MLNTFIYATQQSYRKGTGYNEGLPPKCILSKHEMSTVVKKLNIGTLNRIILTRGYCPLIIDSMEDSTMTPRRRSKRLAEKGIFSPVDNSVISRKKVVIKQEKIETNSNSKPHFEFGGPLGALSVIVGLPIVIYALFYLCNDEYCINYSFDFSFEKLSKSINKPILTINGFIMYVTWIGFHILMERILPGEVAEGALTPRGRKLTYVLSGHLQFWMTIVSMTNVLPNLSWNQELNSFEVTQFSPILNVANIFEEYLSLVTISILGSFVLSFYLYVRMYFIDVKLQYYTLF